MSLVHRVYTLDTPGYLPYAGMAGVNRVDTRVPKSIYPTKHALAAVTKNSSKTQQKLTPG